MDEIFEIFDGFFVAKRKKLADMVALKLWSGHISSYFFESLVICNNIKKIFNFLYVKTAIYRRRRLGRAKTFFSLQKLDIWRRRVAKEKSYWKIYKLQTSLILRSIVTPLPIFDPTNIFTEEITWLWPPRPLK